MPIDNDLSKLKMLKILFFICVYSPLLLDIFNNFQAREL